MLIPKKDRLTIYSYIFRDGVLVTKKELYVKHPEIGVSNLYVINLMKSMKSRGFVTERFCWNHYYFYLTNEGINYLREYLHLPPDVVPGTLKKTAPRQQLSGRPGGRDGPGGRRGKGEGAPTGDYKPTFADQQGGGQYYSRGQGGAGRGQQPQTTEEFE